MILIIILLVENDSHYHALLRMILIITFIENDSQLQQD